MKLGKRQSAYILILLVVAAGIAGFLYFNADKKIIRYTFYGVELEFRGDLRNAKSVSVFPDEETILNKVWDPGIKKINIVYVPTAETSSENSLLGVNGFEVRYKLDTAYKQFSWFNEFTSTELESFENITYENDTLVIALVRPSLSDKTAVEMIGNVIYIKGETPQDFDRATIKFLMTAMNITI